MKKVVFLFGLFVFLVSCSLIVTWEVPDENAPVMLLSENGESVELSLDDGKSYDWYECLDSECSEGVLLGNFITAESGVFSVPGIKYFKCVNGDFTRKFYVSYTGLPVLYIETVTGHEIRNKRNWVSAVFSAEGTENGLSSTLIQVKGRGQSSWFEMPKKGYNLKFDDNVELFGFKKGKRFCLTANYIDETKLANWYAYYLGRNVFNTCWHPDSCNVNLVLNGEYRGLYSFTEAIKINKRRIDITDVAQEENGGFIIEISTTPAEIPVLITLSGISYTLKDSAFDDITGPLNNHEILDYVSGKVNRLENAILGKSNEDFRDLIDVNSMADWYIINEFLVNKEAGFKTSCFCYYDSDEEKFTMGPVWDFDRSFNGNYSDPVITSERFFNYWYMNLVQDSRFTDVLKQRWNEKKSSLLTSFDTIMDEYSNTETARLFDSLRWNSSIRSVDDIESFLTGRFETLDGRLNLL